MILDYISCIPANIAVLDEHFCFVYINKTFSKRLKTEYFTSPETLIGSNVTDIIKDYREVYEESIVGTISFNDTDYTCTYITTKSGNFRILTVEIPNEIVKNLIKYNFTVELSKRIKNPLITTVKMVNLIGYTELSAKQKDYLLKIRDNTIDILKVSNDITDYLKLSLYPERFNVNPIKIDFQEITENIYEVVKGKINNKSISLQFIYGEEFIYTDYQKLMQIMVNIICNSIKHTSKGYIIVKLIEEDQFIKIYFKDTGVPISDYELHLLDKVDKNQDLMVNLELPIAKKLIELLEGEMKIEYTNNSGTMLCFILKPNI